jgi:hypothetical protein
VNSPGAAAAALLLAATLAPATGCARPGNPRGGVPDRRPPAVLQTEPAPAAVVTDGDAEVRFRFDERISERPARGTLNDAVLVSPATGDVRVEHGSDWMGVRVAGGFVPGTVYRVTLLPVVTDLFGNTMRDPFDLVFSTGGPIVETAMAGQALDRITGRPMPDLTVQLLPVAPQADTVRHVSRTDEAGLFFFRYAPLGAYNLVAFQDRNRNGARDPREPFGQRGVLVSADTLLADLTVLEPDTSAATVVRAEAIDSTTLRIVFSDYLDPESVGQTAVTLAAPEGRIAPRVTSVLHPQEHEARRDTAAARAEPAEVPLAVPGQERGGLPAGLPLPRQEVVALLDAPLAPEVEYTVSVVGITNINRIPLGRGEAKFSRKAPPPRARPDSAAAPGATADSVRLPAPPPDSAGVRRDTVAVASRGGRRVWGRRP